jgi:hypothetical protein
MYDGDGWDSTPEGGDVLFGVDKQQLEHLVDEDYLQKVGAFLLFFAFILRLV